MVLTVGSNLFALIGPMLSGYAVDAIEPGPGKVNFGRVFYFAAWMAGFYVVSSIFSYMLQVLMIAISRKVVYRMRKDVFEKLLSLPVGYFDVHQSGDIISRISYDIDTVNVSLSDDVVQLLTTVITVSGAFVMMVLISPRLVLVFAFTLPLSVCITRYLTGKTRPLFRERSAKLGALNGFVEEMVSGQKTLKAYCQEENTIDRFEERNENAMKAYYRAEYYGSIVGPMVNFVNNLSLSLISVFGAVLYLFGQMSIGNISSFVLYSRKFSGPINEAANIISDLQSSIAAAERIFRLLDEEEEPADSPGCVDLKDAQGDVELSHVKFGYNCVKTIIHDLSFHVKPGKMVAVVGPTGAGKTTLINLLMRFYDIQSGNISVDGTDISGITRASLRQSYAMVLQDTWLFKGTILENIRYGRLDATDEEIVEAAKLVNAHDFITHMEHGYDSDVGEGGGQLSTGEKQLISFARAVLANPRIFVLDEATSSIDTKTEALIQEAISTMLTGRTSFLIAHRLSTIADADQIIVVSQGKIEATGTQAELLASCPLYQAMWEAHISVKDDGEVA